MEFIDSKFEFRGVLVKTSAGRNRLAELDDAGAHKVALFKAQKKRDRPPPKTVAGPFVGWDGEGRDDPVKGHIYVLLANSEGNYIWDSNGLSTEKCLAFLLEQRHLITNQANHVMYGGGYDANMILCDLTTDQLARLVVYGSIKWGQYSIAYCPRKFLRISGPSARRAKGTISITLWDVIGFFQMRFVEAVKQWLGVESPELEAMKNARSNFANIGKKRIVDYCLSECVLLVQIMEKYRESASAAGYVPTRWDGAGAQASAMLRAHKIKSYKGEIPREVAIAARHAYFGGRIEPIKYGHYDGKVIGWDINSAYPAAMAQLPCLAHGHWQQYHLPDRFRAPEGFGIYHLTASTDRYQINPLPWRSKSGEIRYPNSVEGWYWTPEARMVWCDNSIGRRMHECWIWEPECDHHPFEFIRDIYNKRQNYKATNNPAEKPLKLGMNSLYGKTVQQIGWRDGTPPPYFQLEWGGYTTSYTRARLWQWARAQQHENIISFETDGIYCKGESWDITPYTHNGLGAWSSKHYDGITLVTSGVYWLHKDGETIAKYRGFDKGALTEKMVLDGWRRGAESISAPHTRFTGMKMALRQPSSNWRQWETHERELRLAPDGKRRPRLDCSCGHDRKTAASHLHETWALPGDGTMSAPYATPFDIVYADWKAEEDAEAECENE